ncbi:MAG TPA: LPS export ABC transporter periplasmic protein LptC [Limnobacter sp.]|nr:LPS export ABC transporter periplasmic protein LptC [Limnobacter sp.]
MKVIQAFFGVLSQYIPLLLTFALAGSSYWFAVQSEMNLFKLSGKADPNAADSYLRNFTVQSHDLQENKYSIVRSASAAHTPAGDVWNITEPDLEQFAPGNVVLKGEANEGIYLMEEDRVILSKNVVVNSTDSGLITVMQSEKIVIDNPANTVSTDQHVQVSRGRQRFEAQGASLNNTTGELRAQGSVKFRIEAKP